jgi:hypothetical protein
LTVVLQTKQTDSDESVRKALATFAEGHWPPLYTFVRPGDYSSVDAQAIVQSLFVHLSYTMTYSSKTQNSRFCGGASHGFHTIEKNEASADLLALLKPVGSDPRTGNGRKN